MRSWARRRGMAKRPPRTLLELAVARVGLLKGPRVVTFMVAWSIAERELGHEPTLHEYREWWNESERTAYREQALFRECFPDETTPSRLMAALASAWDERRGVRGLGAVPAQLVAA
jgi:hypothetical protein